MVLGIPGLGRSRGYNGNIEGRSIEGRRVVVESRCVGCSR